MHDMHKHATRAGKHATRAGLTQIKYKKNLCNNKTHLQTNLPIASIGKFRTHTFTQRLPFNISYDDVFAVTTCIDVTDLKYMQWCLPLYRY